MDTEAIRAPAAVGLNVMLILQLEPAATLPPQVFVWLKSPLFAPITAMLVMVRVSVPVFDKPTT
jgi:hypothetical protein